MEELIIAGLCLTLAAVGLLPTISIVVAMRARKSVRRLQGEVDDLQHAVRRLGRDKRTAEVGNRVAEVVQPPAAEVSEPESLPEVVEPVPEVVEPVPEVVEPVAPVLAKVPVEPEVAPKRKRSLEHLGSWVFAAFGGLALLVGALLFFAYGLDAGWFAFFGPGARFATGVGVGLAAIVVSESLVRRGYDVPAAGMGGAGVGVLYGALFAGHGHYELFGQIPAFALMSGVTVVAVLLAWRRDSQFLAVLGLVAGLLTPVLLSTGENRALALLLYLAVVNAGVLSAAVLRKWPAIIALTGLGTLVLQLGWAGQYAAADQVVYGLGAAAVFAAMAAAAVFRGDKRVGMAAAGTFVAQAIAVVPLVIPQDLLSWEGHSVQAVLHDPGPAVWLLPLFFLGLTAGLRALVERRGWTLLGKIGLPVVMSVALLAVGAWESELGDLDLFHPLHLVPALIAVAPLVGWWAVKKTEDQEVVLPILLVTTGILGGIGAAVGGSAPVFVGLALTVVAAIGAVASVRRRDGWTLVAGLAGAACAAFLGLEELADTERVHQLVLPLGAAVVVLTAWPFVFFRGDGDRTRLLPWLASALAGPVLYLPLHLAWEEALGTDAIGLLPLGLAVVSLYAASVVKRMLQSDSEAKGSDRNLALYVVAGTAFASLAIPVQLDGQWVTLGWIAEAAVLAWMSRRFTHPGVGWASLGLAVLACGRILMDPTVVDFPAELNLVFNDVVLTWGALGVGLLLTAHWLDQGRALVDGFRVTRWIRTAAVIAFFMLLNLEVAIAYAVDGQPNFSNGTLAQEMVRSMSWAMFGASLLSLGVWQKVRGTRLLAMGFLLLATMKVFFVDLWDLSGMWRVGSVLGAAVALLGAAILLQRVVLRNEDEPADEPTREVAA
ncbi:MAG: DUF2339 domain-containing protein [Proteobacteria bacterium]|nr:DUF2339 domain-containing protein [Pseudomonadota bacterium]MCP4920257.1 DUF2339 domain-containing protein [Pseudomonadota bacterium]